MVGKIFCARCGCELNICEIVPMVGYGLCSVCCEEAVIEEMQPVRKAPPTSRHRLLAHLNFPRVLRKKEIRITPT